LDEVKVDYKKTIYRNSRFTQTGSVNPYGANYHVFPLSNTLKEVAVDFYHQLGYKIFFIGIKNNIFKAIKEPFTSIHGYGTFRKALTPGQWDINCLIIVLT
jgi:hypothetical protein